MAKKMFYSMGEVAEMFDVKPSLLRHWEAKFDILRPHKNKKGNRMFTPEDVENLKLIYHLVKERGMTLAGAAQYLKNGITDTMRRDMELLDRLQKIRAELVEVREQLKDVPDGYTVVEVAQPEEEIVIEEPTEEEKSEDLVEEQPEESKEEPAEEEPTDSTPRPRGAKGGRRNKKQEAKLFEVKPEKQRPIAPFFDQTLF